MIKKSDQNPQQQDDLEIENEVDLDDLELENNGNQAKESDSDGNQVVELSKNKVELLKKLLISQKENLEQMNNLLSGVMSDEDVRVSIGQMSVKKDSENGDTQEGQIVEGVFDGENMIGPDGKQYSVPANYASKSKLVEGDILKLTITANGTFVYKQIGPIDRQRVVGNLVEDSSGNFKVKAGDKVWRVLTASVTYFKGQNGDEIIILVPKVGDSKWAAVENVVRQ